MLAEPDTYETCIIRTFVGFSARYRVVGVRRKAEDDKKLVTQHSKAFFIRDDDDSDQTEGPSSQRASRAAPRLARMSPRPRSPRLLKALQSCPRPHAPPFLERYRGDFN